ncbi:Glutamate receptor ionotropic, kainate 2-like 7, partial [Homarus americanus]
YSCVIVKDGKWGAPKRTEDGSDGGWDGLVGDILAGKGDVIVAPLDHTLKRSTVVDFCFSFAMLGYKMVIRRPSSQAYTWTSYTREFDSVVWPVVLLFLVGAAFLFYLTGFSPSEVAHFTLGDAFLMTFGSLCNQSTYLKVNSGAARVVMIIIYITNTLFFVHYTCFLISNLTVSSESPPFRNLQGALDDGSYYMGYMKSSSIDAAFQFAPSGIYHKAWQEMVEPIHHTLSPNDALGIQRALEDRYVQMIDETHFLSTYGHNCDLLMLSPTYLKVPTTFAVPKGSPLRRIIDY